MIAAIANRTLKELDNIAYNSDSGTQHCRLLNHQIMARDLRLKTPRICPLCVKERTFIEAHWDLAVMTGCPVHRCNSVSSCPSCGKPLHFYRPGLLTCPCGSDLAEIELTAIPPAEAELLDVVRRTVLRLPRRLGSAVKLPMHDLAKMKLESLLGLIHIIGRNAREIQRVSDRSVLTDDVGLASEVLSNWPNQFVALLKCLIETKKEGIGGFPMKALEPLLRCLRRREMESDFRPFDFASRACIDFIANHCDGAVVMQRTRRRYGIDGNERFVNLAALARRLRISKPAAKKLVESGLVEAAPRKVGGSKRFVIKGQTAPGPRLPGNIVSRPEAAAEIGISSSLLLALRDSGAFEINSTPIRTDGYHSLDVESFIDKVWRRAQPELISNRDHCQSVRKALIQLQFSIDAQRSLVEGIIAGRIGLWAKTGDTQLGDLLVRSDDIRNICETTMPWYASTMSAREAARLMRYGNVCISGLAKAGYLEQVKTPIGTRLTRNSVENFTKQFTPLKTVAKKTGTSSRAMMERCKRHSMCLLVVLSGGIEHPFIRREDIEAIESLTEKSPVENVHKGNPNALLMVYADDIAGDEQPSYHDTVTLQCAAKTLEVSRKCIGRLILSGHLLQIGTARAFRITKDSLSRFAKEYVSFMALGRMSTINQPQVTHLCKASGIFILKVQGRQNEHRFIRRKDLNMFSTALSASKLNSSVPVLCE